MASSSHSHHHNHFKNTNNFVEQEKEHNSQRHVQEEEEEEEENWLKLGLGLGRNDDIINTSSFNNQVVVHHHHHHHGSNNNPQVLLCSDSSSSHIGSHGEHNHHHQHQQMLKLGLGLGFQQDSMLLGSMEEKMMISYGNRLLGSCNNDDDDENGSSWQIDSTIVDPYGGGGGDSHHYNKCGLWFTLRSSTNRRGEALPQIPKAYIRIRDENMTVFMVKKYLVRKLGLSNEAEIDILCMGESLSQIQTLKQVREAVWIPRLVESLDSTTFSLGDSNHNNNDDDDMSLNHIMSLLYRKHCFLN